MALPAHLSLDRFEVAHQALRRVLAECQEFFCGSAILLPIISAIRLGLSAFDHAAADYRKESRT
jgi:hypothetical protein